MMLGGCGTEPGVSKNQTDFTVVDEQGTVTKFLTVDNSEVVKMKETVEGFVKALNNRSYKTINGSEEYGYYTQGIIDIANKQGDIAATIKVYKDNQLENSYVGLDGLKMAFNKDFTKCDITVVGKLKVTSASAAHLSSLKIGKDVVFGYDYTFKWLKQNDVWKIHSVTAANPHEIK
ncbi:hypothetical protein P0092_08225 [Ruminiclostridium papyrosolvens DSM 2782]|nr:hypothetical protein [Ruminiclostridium papyrosolvens]WES35936.1 hypothetical protein P0092_08225 [Ruminiclostridium papyrosolvens DSM 2782]